MAWSTRQLAELANTTVNTVRHYHKVGLLEQPRRASNGYKLYDASHLIRLLQINRLSDLGFTLGQIAGMDVSEQEPDEQLRLLDAELAASMDRLARSRAEVAQLRKHGAPVDSPAGFAPVTGRITDAQRAMLSVYSTVFSEETLGSFGTAIAEQQPLDAEFEELSDDADDATIESLAARMATAVRESRAEHPELQNALTRSPHGAASAGETVASALAEVYGPAHLRVLERMAELVAGDDAKEQNPDSSV